ncbi:MAG TPA: serine dehydratase beta chain, partial [Coxiellaceae bacterium]|nr:serine dehydratase beta chain [Coxiellaceae bacterium]
MSISIFEIFSIGIGPSSSHTVGPMRAARKFVIDLKASLDAVTRVEVTLYGSLAFTGKGHGTHKAILMGLEGESPEAINPDTIPERLKKIEEQHQLSLLGQHTINFHTNSDLIFNFKEELPYHPNGMQFKAFDVDGNLIEQDIYYSIGGGFIVNEAQAKADQAPASKVPVQYPFKTAQELFDHCRREHLRVSELMFANEQAWRSPEEIRTGILNIARTMEECINKGCHSGGILEGGLQVKRRAPALYQKLLAQG